MPLNNSNIEQDTLNAADPKNHAWVMANAGAGKTTLLTRRVLRLLLAGARPASILCLTYTKAAAAEMRERVHTALGNWATSDTATLEKELTALTGAAPTTSMVKRARALLAYVLDEPEGLRIQTIHAFCQSVLARFPLEADIPPHFEVMDDRASEELMTQACEHLLDNEYPPEIAEPLANAIHFLAGRYNDEQFADILKMLREQGRKLRSLLQGGVERQRVILELLAAERGISLTDTPETIISRHDGDAAHITQLRAACALLCESKNKTTPGFGKAMAEWLSEKNKTRELWDEYRLVFLKKDGDKREKLYTGDIKDADLQEVMAAEQQRVVATAEAISSTDILEATRHMLALAAALLGLYASMKSKRALLDYDDLILATRDLLKDGRQKDWVLFKLDGGLDHLLVDEAQDTSAEQWEIVSALTEDFFTGETAHQTKRTLFVVGDEKQSIFGFQGAAPQAFLAMREHFLNKAKAAGEVFFDIKLNISRRSGPAVLDAVDTTFSTLGEHALCQDAIAHTVWDKRARDASSVELWPLVEPEDAEEFPNWHLPVKQEYTKATPHRLAKEIAAAIRGWLDTGKMLESQGRAIEPGDIMILVTRRGGFVSPMTSELKRLKIPVISAERMVLNENLAVMDMLALAKFALLPEDDLNLACLLKSPLCNANEETLFQVAHGRSGTLWEALQDVTTPSVREAVSFLRHMLARVDYIGPYEFFCEALYEQQGFAKIIGRMGEEYREALEELLDCCMAYEQQHTPTMQGFVHWMEASETVLKRDMENATGKVRIMTVHSAKGLEAPVVFLANSSSLPSDNNKVPQPLWTQAGGMAFPSWSISSKGDDESASQSRREVKDETYSEYIRLLYVGMTRARDTLIMTGWKNKRPTKREEEESWYGLAMAALKDRMTPLQTPLGEGFTLSTAQEIEKPQLPVTAKATETSAPHWLKDPAPAEPAPTRPLTPSRQETGQTPASSPLEMTSSLRRGTLIHQLFEHLPLVAEEKRMAAAEAFLKKYAPEFDASAQSQMVEETIAVLSDPQFAEIFSGQSLAEVPVTGIITSGGVPVTLSGQIDRLVVGEKNIWIVDYKTNRFPPATAADTPVEYVRQMAEYRRLLHAIYPGRTVTCALLWTCGPKLTVLPESLFSTQSSLTAA